jgi:hypothetical protein
MPECLGRFRFHGSRQVSRVTDCSSRRQDAGDAGTDNFLERFKATCDEILARLRNRPQTAAQDNRRQYDALSELNRKNAAFWKDKVQ